MIVVADAATAQISLVPKPEVRAVQMIPSGEVCKEPDVPTMMNRARLDDQVRALTLEVLARKVHTIPSGELNRLSPVPATNRFNDGDHATAHAGNEPRRPL